MSSIRLRGTDNNDPPHPPAGDRAAEDFASLWRVTGGPALQAPSIHATEDADVVVVGAGLTGLSTAISMAEAGASVIVLEAETPGAGASGSTGAEVIPGLRHFPDELIKAYGTQVGRRAYEFGAGAAEDTFRLIARQRIECDAIQGGWLQVADTPSNAVAGRQRHDAWQRRGDAVAWLERPALQALLGTDYYSSGWMHRGGGTLHPMRFVDGLARAAQRLGVRLFNHSRVQDITRTGATWRIATADGNACARALLLATNATPDRLWPGLREMVLPVWSFQIAVEADSLDTAPPQGVAVSDMRPILTYFRTDPDGRLTIGGKGTLRGPRQPNDFKTQHRMLRRLYPTARKDGIRYRWGGRVAVTIDRLPRIVSIGPNALANFGCNGKGVAWCTALGASLAEALLSGDLRCLPIPVTEPRPIPVHALRQLYVAAGSSWLRLQDALGHAGK